MTSLIWVKKIRLWAPILFFFIFMGAPGAAAEVETQLTADKTQVQLIGSEMGDQEELKISLIAPEAGTIDLTLDDLVIFEGGFASAPFGSQQETLSDYIFISKTKFDYQPSSTPQVFSTSISIRSGLDQNRFARLLVTFKPSQAESLPYLLPISVIATQNEDSLPKNILIEPASKILEFKIMKQLSFLFIFMFFITLSLPQFVIAQEDCVAMNTPPGANCGSWDTHTVTIVGNQLHSSFGTCNLYVSYQTRICTITDGNCTRTFEQFKFVGLAWDWDVTSPCISFTQFLMPGYPDDFAVIDKIQFEKFLGKVLPYLMDIHYIHYLASLSDTERLAIKCDGSDPDCEMPDCVSYEASYISSSCRDMCYNFENINHPVLTFGDCGASPQGCCILTATFCPCYDINNNNYNVFRELNLTVTQGGCSGTGPLYGTCYYGTGGEDSIYEPCQTLCPNIEPW